jgi:hyperosmotically inducible periplasmic protein
MKTPDYVKFAGILVTALCIGTTAVRADDRDDRIEKSFKDSFTYRTDLKDADVSVDAEAGVVTLKGKVLNEDQRRLAEDTVRGLPGVTAVNNELKVRNEPKESSDEWIALKVRSSLLYHRNVALKGVDVAVMNGVVTLTGTARSDAEKSLAGEYASDIKGVTRVDNQLRVVPEAERTPARIDNANADLRTNRDANRDAARTDNRVGAADTRVNDDNRLNERRAGDREYTGRTTGDKIDDASITARIKSSLAVRRSTSATRTEVTTLDGVVTIRGEARNTAEKDLVTKIANDIDGVRDVRNEMVVRAE